MAKVIFKNVLNQNAGFLEERGYEYKKEKISPKFYRYSKTLNLGVHLSIDFQTSSWTTPPQRGFYVNLSRERLLNYSGREDEFIQFRFMLLYNIMNGVYQMWDFQKNKYNWEYLSTSKESLVKELGEIQPLLIKYGIPWLEDPKSNLEWL